ncbi:MAG: AMP-binding protein [Deltaproteobacteria bacterium]|nr:AMP-binding protein [Deltaproteobacteria bacterium]
MNKLSLGFKIAKSLSKFCLDEFRRSTLFANLPGLPKLQIAEEMSWGELVAEKAARYGDRTFLNFDDQTLSYADMNDRANQLANFLKRQGGGRGAGVAMLMANSPRFLDVFFGLQKIGMYAVPINTSLKGDSLRYVLKHCDAKMVVMDEAFADEYFKAAGDLKRIEGIIINGMPPRGISDSRLVSLDSAYDEPKVEPGIGHDPDDICLIMYTSGTTGRSKGVVYRYRKSSVKLLSLVANLLYDKNDVLYTCMPLFHGNALFVTTTCAMHVGARVALSKKFSASRFFEEIRQSGATTFNTIGAMIPILMKQPERPEDSQNSVKFIISAACPVDLWEAFEKRFGFKIYETYGAVDGGGKTILNLGTGPVGSIGKPPMKLKYRLVDSEMLDVPVGTPGELIFAASKSKKGGVEYYKDEKASGKKQKSGWILTGDLMKRDKKGYLYFTGRNTESMRIKGENVSAFEVENTLHKHPAVLEVAVFAVPSDLAEDDIMACASLVEGKSVTESDLVAFARKNLPKFAVPRYVKIVEEFSKTVTQRIKKKELENKGIVAGTYDAAKDAFA